MSVDIKSFFFIWCQKNGCTPTYESRPTGPKHRQRFLCEVRVPDIAYVGVGNSTVKKDAEKNASRDFVNYLVRVGKIEANSVPKDAANANAEGGSAAVEDKDKPSTVPDRPQYGKGMNVFTSGFGPQDLGQAYRPYVPSQDEIKREEANMEAAESLDVNASIHGNWTIENARSKLNQWLQNQKIKAEFKYTSIGPDHAK